MSEFVPSREDLPSWNRRRFLQALAAAAAAGTATACSLEGDGSSASGEDAKIDRTTAIEHETPAALAEGSESVLLLLYPGFTQIDVIGPHYALSCMAGAKVRLIAKDSKPVETESGFSITPQLDFASCPEKPDLLLVPGGMVGTLAAIEDRETLDFIRDLGRRASMVGSVCTGSLLLGAAGLLDGYHATSHWQTLELLPLVGAKPSSERIVFDRNRVTAAGVTAGIDLGMELVRHYRGDFYAKGVQLLGQYDPKPPFPGGGNPESADLAVVAMLKQMHAPFLEQSEQVIRAALAKG